MRLVQSDVSVNPGFKLSCKCVHMKEVEFLTSNIRRIINKVINV